MLSEYEKRRLPGILELQEACRIHQGLLHEKTNSLKDMQAIVKTWKNRLPVISDDLSHWSDVFTWRQHHYQFIIKHVDAKHEQGTSTSVFGVHASAQAIIHFGKIARKHNLTGVCLDALARIYTIPSVPVDDCFYNIRQRVKCHLQMAQVTGAKDLQEGFEVMETSDIGYFSKELTAEFLALKGMLLAQLGHISEAGNTFAVAVEKHDTLVKGWALWGDFLESQFIKSPNPDIGLGVSTITCFLYACKHQNESKSRKYLAKVRAKQLQRVTDAESIKASESMVSCTKIMHILRDTHPTVVLALEGFADQYSNVFNQCGVESFDQTLLRFYKSKLEDKGSIERRSRRSLLRSGRTVKEIRRFRCVSKESSAANADGATEKETSRRFLHMTVPRVVAWSTQMRLIEDNPASVSLLDIYKGACATLDVEYDSPVSKYYERLAGVQFTLQLSLTCFCEYVLHLTRLNPDMLYIHQDSGLLNVSYFKFDVEDPKGELNANRPVPFRLTPNIQELLTETSISGPLTASMIATAKCFVYPNFEVPSILRAILRDEMIFILKKRQEEKQRTVPTGEVKGEQIIKAVTRAVDSINARLNSLSHFDGTESKGIRTWQEVRVRRSDWAEARIRNPADTWSRGSHTRPGQHMVTRLGYETQPTRGHETAEKRPKTCYE
ncbi:unnamed protein product [Nesidiocoris tenuis]|uniref:PI3K/PI4K catalytic domain-containing protein n=1 Tax=Nesidiocoris tenuis TaxID=355587 RepID=A0A6H5FX40_9HEMI|nr:unnamed protein product [Nesidiocoris tenuis]